MQSMADEDAREPNMGRGCHGAGNVEGEKIP